MNKRKLPFGYKMQQGIICIEESEADLVRKIFRDYADGISYQQLANKLNLQSIPYDNSSRAWSKSIVARILNNQIYIGTASHPPIIDSALLRRAKIAKPILTSATERQRQAKLIRVLSKCAQCGSQIKLSSNNHSWERWNCPTCSAITCDVTTQRIQKNLVSILNKIVCTPTLIPSPISNKRPTHSSVMDIESKFHATFENPAFDDAHARTLALDLASARFDAIGSEDYETIRIRRLLAGAQPSGELDAELLRQITAAILIHPDGAVSLKLKNGQTIGRCSIA